MESREACKQRIYKSLPGCFELKLNRTTEEGCGVFDRDLNKEKRQQCKEKTCVPDTGNSKSKDPEETKLGHLKKARKTRLASKKEQRGKRRVTEVSRPSREN